MLLIIYLKSIKGATDQRAATEFNTHAVGLNVYHLNDQ